MLPDSRLYTLKILVLALACFAAEALIALFNPRSHRHWPR
jgi:hypothetical protein